MSGIKKLAGQTIWYGVPRIMARFLNFGISLLGFQLYDPNGSYAFTQIYAVIPFLNILFTYGLETSFFRFAQLEDRQKLYNTLNVSVLVSSLLFSLILYICRDPFTSFIGMESHPEYILWMIGITFFDALCTLPLSKLRLEERPRKYAFVNVATTVINVCIVLFIYFVAKPAQEANPESFLGKCFDPSIGIGYFIIANLIASAASLLLLYKEFAGFRFHFDGALWKKVMHYSYPLIIVGFGGMINEMLSRVVYRKVLHDAPQVEEFELGVFGANYKLAVLITIFIQIFRLAAEPFFFNQSKHEHAQKTYARVMKFFVIACGLMFLVVSLYLDVWKILIASGHPIYAAGIHIVPILAMGSVFLGIYYNLSIWYKLTNHNMVGAYITLAGAAITILLNMALIPLYRYTGAAWATFVCYAFMMVTSYFLGQKYYPVPYAIGKLLGYIGLAAGLYMVQRAIGEWMPLNINGRAMKLFLVSTVLLVVYLLWIAYWEKEELKKLPFIGKYIGTKK